VWIKGEDDRREDSAFKLHAGLSRGNLNLPRIGIIDLYPQGGETAAASLFDDGGNMDIEICAVELIEGPPLDLDLPQIADPINLKRWFGWGDRKLNLSLPSRMCKEVMDII
jgi:hypothetical protein